MKMSKVDIKIVLLGKEFSGKTSLVERFVFDRFTGENSYQNTIGAAFGAKKMELDGKVVMLGLWDTAGSERYESIGKIYYRKSNAAIICYDLTDLSSFSRVKFWTSELKKYEEKCRIYLCGTKKDLIQSKNKSRAVDYYSITDFADEIRAEIFETSSKYGDRVNELFHKIAYDFLQENEPIKVNSENGIGIFRVEDEQNKTCHC